MNYKVIFRAAEEGGYDVFVPALPGCVTQGDTFEEAQKNIKEAISLYLSVLKEDGSPIPKGDNDSSENEISSSIAISMDL